MSYRERHQVSASYLGTEFTEEPSTTRIVRFFIRVGYVS